DPAQLVDDARGGEIAERERIGRAAARRQRDDHQNAFRPLEDLHALPPDLLRQTLLDRVQPVLHVHLRGVDVGSGLERHRDRRAVRAARRRHVLKALDAVQLLLDDLGDVLRDGGRIGTRIDRFDRQRRRRDRRVLLDRQRAQRERPGEQDRQRDDPREHGTIDENARRHGFDASWPAPPLSPPAVSDCAISTDIPGSILCSPSTMTRSPTASPLRTTQSAPSISPSTTRLGSTVLSSPTTMTLASSPEITTARCGITVTFRRTPISTLARTNCPGRSTQSGFGTSARSAAVPVSSSIERSRKSTKPACGYSRPSSSRNTTRSCCSSGTSSSPSAIRLRTSSSLPLDAEKFT